MKFYDCVMFRDEVDLLRLRIDILRDKVDDFLVFEGAHEHLSGKERRIALNDEALEMVRSEHPDKNIIHIKVPLKQDTAWGRENEHRIKIYNTLNKMGLDLDDTILISDCDEIPNPRKLKEATRHDFCFFDQMYFIHFLDLYSSKNVTGTVAIKWHKLKLIQTKYNGAACQILRNNKDFGPEIDDGGWHYSYVGGADQVTTKARTIAEGSQSYNKDLFEKQIKEALENKASPYSSEKLVKLNLERDYYGRYIKLRSGNITEHQDGNVAFPEYLLENSWISHFGSSINNIKYKHLFSYEN